jgi:hypothetical protein
LTDNRLVDRFDDAVPVHSYSFGVGLNQLGEGGADEAEDDLIVWDENRVGVGDTVATTRI